MIILLLLLKMLCLYGCDTERLSAFPHTIQRGSSRFTRRKKSPPIRKGRGLLRSWYHLYSQATPIACLCESIWPGFCVWPCKTISLKACVKWNPPASSFLLSGSITPCVNVHQSVTAYLPGQTIRRRGAWSRITVLCPILPRQAHALGVKLRDVFAWNGITRLSPAGCSLSSPCSRYLFPSSLFSYLWFILT